MSWIQVCIAISELLAIFLIFKLWHSEELLFFRIIFSVIAIIPFLGPFFLLWSTNMPSRQPKVFQDRERYSTDVLDKWRDVLDEKNPHARFKKWKQKVDYEDSE